ncbi:MAG: DUF3551 domain-containing protein [Xanthobacteraceae bacterium]|nr:DUF3551 domain-containing protein [Xanthobacteraceae bacterium]
MAIVMTTPYLNRRGPSEVETVVTKSIRRLALVAGFAVASVVAMAFASPAQASWCAVYQSGAENCGFSTQAQCAAAVSGAGGF